MADRSSVLLRLARAIRRYSAVESLPLRMCRASVDILQAGGGAITLAYTEPERVTLCATNDTATMLENLQEVLGQGPGRDAFDSSAAVYAVLGATERRWPMLVDAIRPTLGELSVLALPMRPDGQVLGVLTVHAVPDSGVLETGQFLADALGAALVHDLREQEADLSGGPWASRARVHQATGMIVAQLRIRPEDAVALLRAHAFAHELSVDEVAAHVVDFRLDFSTTDDSGDSA